MHYGLKETSRSFSEFDSLQQHDKKMFIKTLKELLETKNLHWPN